MTWGASEDDLLAAETLAIASRPYRLPTAPRLGRRPRVVVIGHGRHGKDTAAERLASRLGWSFVSSSEFAARKAVFPLVADIYPDWRAAYEDRDNHRELWFHAIAAYNRRPGPMLAEQIFEQHEIYIGMRSRAEFTRARPLFDFVIWVDASRRLPPEPSGSNELGPEDADAVLDNNGTLCDLDRALDRLVASAAAD